MHRSESRTLSTLLAVMGMTVALTLSPDAGARTVEGFNMPDTLQLGGQSLKLVGAGVRTKWFVNVYVMGVYQKSAGGSASKLINNNEPKYLWLHMMRGIGGGKMRSAIDDGFESNASEAVRTKLAPGINKLKASFPAKIKKGLDIGFWYRPGKGTTVRFNSRNTLTVEGKDFMVALWSIWFGRRPADKGLKKSIISG